MEKNIFLQELISNGVAIICRTPEEVAELSEMVGVLYPGYSTIIMRHKTALNHPECKGEIAIRLKKYDELRLDYGWDFPSYYIRQNMKLVYFSELNCDLGEIDAGIDISDLDMLFNFG